MLQRGWKIPLLVGLGFLFILNQGYWEETTETLALVLASAVVCMGVGVPIGIAAARRPSSSRVTSAGHIKGGQKAMAAGFQLSEYWMPGLGGRALWRPHAENTARREYSPRP